jgi:hypothetical protein
MKHITLSMISVVSALAAPSALAGSLEVPLASLFQYSPMQLGRSVNSIRQNTTFIPRMIFNKEIALNQVGQASIGGRCQIVATKADSSPGYFNAYLNVAPGGKINAHSSYEMRLISYQQEVLKIALVEPKETLPALELTCTDPSIQSWTVSEFESKLGTMAKIYASAKLANLKQVAVTEKTSDLLNTLRGSMFNGFPARPEFNCYWVRI